MTGQYANEPITLPGQGIRTGTNQQPLKLNAYRKILVIRFSSIGDIVLTSPVLRCLKQQAGAEIHYLTKAKFAGLVEANPYVSRVFSLQGELSPLIALLEMEDYDYVVDLHHNLRSWRIRRALNLPGGKLDKINRQKWLMVNFKLDLLPRKHIVDRYLETVAPLGVTNDERGLDYFIPSDAELALPEDLTGAGEAFLRRFREAQGRYVAVVVGAAHATKRLPLDRLVDICRKLSLPVVLLGGPAEQGEGKQIAGRAGAHVFNGCGAFSLHQSASIIRQAWKVLTPDTGMMHVAAALDKPTVSLWGNTIPAFGMYPYDPQNQTTHRQLEVSGLGCRPCSKIGFRRCPRGHFRCMQQITDEAILSALLAD